MLNWSLFLKSASIFAIVLLGGLTLFILSQAKSKMARSEPVIGGVGSDYVEQLGYSGYGVQIYQSAEMMDFTRYWREALLKVSTDCQEQIGNQVTPESSVDGFRPPLTVSPPCRLELSLVMIKSFPGSIMLYMESDVDAKVVTIKNNVITNWHEVEY